MKCTCKTPQEACSECTPPNSKETLAKVEDLMDAYSLTRKRDEKMKSGEWLLQDAYGNYLTCSEKEHEGAYERMTNELRAMGVDNIPPNARTIEVEIPHGPSSG